MPSRTPVTYGVTYTDGPSTNSYITSARQTRFITLSILDSAGKPHNLGGIQTVSMTHSNGGRFEAQSSDDYLEIIFGMRQWSGTFTRRMLRGADMEEMAMRLYPDMSDIDWREIPLLLSTRYNYTNYTGAQTYENASWQWRKCFCTDHRQDQIPNPTDVMRETMTLIAAGYARTTGNGTKVGVPDALAAASYFSVPSSQTAAQVSPNVATPFGSTQTVPGQAGTGGG